MILRSIALRHGRRAVAKPPVRAWKRYLASTVDSHAAAATPAVNGPELDHVAQEYYRFQEHKKVSHAIGTTIAPHYQPHTLLTNPPSPKDITLELLLASQSHLGHATSLWNPANARYIFGVRQGVHIISLDATASHLRRACAIVRAVAERGGLILFVGTREGQSRAVVKAAEMAGACHLFDRWIPGSITNGQQIVGQCATKVVDELDREVKGFEPQLETYGALKPDLVVCLNPLENSVLLHECGLNNIPTIGVIDTDANPTWVTYPIPANDDSLRCIQVIAGTLGRAGQEGQQARLRRAAHGGRLPYSPPHSLTPPTGRDKVRGAAYDYSSERADIAADPEARVQEAADVDLMAIREFSNFAENTPEAVAKAVDMFTVEEGASEGDEMLASALDAAKLEDLMAPDRSVEDMTLKRMIALKRRDFGEELSAADQEELAKHDAEFAKPKLESSDAAVAAAPVAPAAAAADEQAEAHALQQDRAKQQSQAQADAGALPSADKVATETQLSSEAQETSEPAAQKSAASEADSKPKSGDN